MFNKPYITCFPSPHASKPIQSYQQSTGAYADFLAQCSKVYLDNLYVPFASELDWCFVQLAKLCGPLGNAINKLLALPGVCSLAIQPSQMLTLHLIAHKPTRVIIQEHVQA